MTWGEFKKLMEASGYTDDTVLEEVDGCIVEQFSEEIGNA